MSISYDGSKVSNEDKTTYEDKVRLTKATMQALYPVSVWCGLISFVDKKKNLAYNVRQLIFPTLCLILTTALLMHEFPNMFVLRGKRIAVMRHKSSKYNLYVIHVVYFFKLYTTLFVSITRSKWLPVIFYEIFKINKALKLDIKPKDGNRLTWLAVIFTAIPYIVRLITFPGKTVHLEIVQTAIEMSVFIPVILNAQHHQVCILLSDAFDSINQNLIRQLQSSDLTDAEKTKLTSKYNEAHRRLCDLIRLINDLYKYPILMELLNNSMGVATIMFHTLDFSAHLNWWYNSSNGLSRGIQIVVRLYFLCYSCTEVIAKSKETINALVKGYELSHDKILQREIEVFVRRIQNERVVFDICGLFSINTKTFISILRITTSFVLILIQFNPHPSIRANK
ncbi:hypothetical protein M8J77_003649 [Diaphorina citri]|nr:hypothetical protein M8J77_003649 [Diaphorina citri]